MKDDVVRNSGLEIKAVDYEDSTVSYHSLVATTIYNSF